MFDAFKIIFIAHNKHVELFFQPFFLMIVLQLSNTLTIFFEVQFLFFKSLTLVGK